jgi:predicted translin family RNA/ssDNA-binding protein
MEQTESDFQFMRRIMMENLQYLIQIKEMKQKMETLEKCLEMTKEMYLQSESARLRLILQGLRQDSPLVSEDKDANPSAPV